MAWQANGNHFAKEVKQFLVNYDMPTPFTVPLTMGMLTDGNESITWADF